MYNLGSFSCTLQVLSLHRAREKKQEWMRNPLERNVRVGSILRTIHFCERNAKYIKETIAYIHQWISVNNCHIPRPYNIYIMISECQPVPIDNYINRDYHKMSPSPGFPVSLYPHLSMTYCTVSSSVRQWFVFTSNILLATHYTFLVVSITGSGKVTA